MSDQSEAFKWLWDNRFTEDDRETWRRLFRAMGKLATAWNQQIDALAEDAEKHANGER